MSVFMYLCECVVFETLAFVCWESWMYHLSEGDCYLPQTRILPLIVHNTNQWPVEARVW